MAGKRPTGGNGRKTRALFRFGLVSYWLKKSYDDSDCLKYIAFFQYFKKKKIPHKEHYLPRDTYTTCIKILTRKTYITLHYVTSRYLHQSYNTIFTLLVLFYHFTIFTLFTLLYLHQLHYDTFFDTHTYMAVRNIHLSVKALIKKKTNKTIGKYKRINHLSKVDQKPLKQKTKRNRDGFLIYSTIKFKKLPFYILQVYALQQPRKLNNQPPLERFQQSSTNSFRNPTPKASWFLAAKNGKSEIYCKLRRTEERREHFSGLGRTPGETCCG